MKNATLLIFLLLGTLAKGQLLFFESQPLTNHSSSSTFWEFNPAAFANFLAPFPGNTSPVIPAITTTILLPMPNGHLESFEVWEAPVLAPAVAMDFPDYRDFKGVGLQNPELQVRFGWNANGFYGIISGDDLPIWLTSVDRTTNSSYQSSYSNPTVAPVSFSPMLDKETIIEGQEKVASGDQLRKYEIAIVATGNYTNAIGSQAAAFSEIQTNIARLNAIFERELSITFQLVSSIDLVFTTGTSPFTGEGTGTVLSLQEQNQTILDTRLGAANYDIGHLFDSSPTDAAEGAAFLKSACNELLKGWAISRGGIDPTGDSFIVNIFANQIGRQLGANNTFNSDSGACLDNRNGTTAYEPGSGSTIMSMNGCGADNLQDYKDDYFHAISLEEIISYAVITESTGCPEVIATGNTIPLVEANPDNIAYIIPGGTPFLLEGEASDVDGDILTYCWEGMNLGEAGSIVVNKAPYFRSYPPTTSPVRTFPALEGLLDGTNTCKGELLPTDSTQMDFRLTVRDNNPVGGGINQSDISVEVDDSTGPFLVSSQATPVSLEANGTNTMTITWDVAGTTGGKVNCSRVDLLFSSDNGATFSWALAEDTANDGFEEVLVPGITTSSGRIMVRCANNIFFDINDAAIQISKSCAAEGETFSPNTAFSAPEGDPSLNISPTNPTFGTEINSFSGSFGVGDPSVSLLTVHAITDACQTFTNQPYYTQTSFEVDATDTYNFAQSGIAPWPLHIYEFSFDPDNPCTNLVDSNNEYDPSDGIPFPSSNLKVVLQPDIEYILVVTGYFSSDVDDSFTVSMSSLSSGKFYDGPAPPPADYTYQYLVVQNENNTILAITADPDLSASATYPPGTYTIYGFSYDIVEDPMVYVGKTLDKLKEDILDLAFCGDLSDNSQSIQVLGGVLPVSLVSFQAAKKGQQVVLRWETETEQNNHFFTLERSADSRQFAPLTKVEGAGTTIHSQTYHFVDETPLPGWNYYQLWQTDYDGRREHLGIRAIWMDTQQADWQVFPNPANNQLSFSFHTAEPTPVQIQLRSMTGQLLYEVQFTFSDSQAVQTLPLKNLPDGSYLLSWQTATAQGGEVVFKN